MAESTRLPARAVAVSASALLLAGGAFAPALADPGKGGKPHGTKQGAKHTDPPGNNGTFKVDGLAYDDGKGNEPHVTCEFRLKFYGFDDGQTGDVTIDGHAPSGSGVVSSRAGVPFTGALAYTADDLDLAGLTAHPKQGYHLKVTLATGEPGGVKHKVLWYEPCAAPAPVVGGTEEENDTDDTVTGTPTDTGTDETGTGGTGVTAPTTGTSARTEVLGTRLDRVRDTVPAAAPAAPAARVLGETLTRPGGLPFTGSFAAVLAGVGAAMLVLGGTVLVLARRRRLT